MSQVKSETVGQIEVLDPRGVTGSIEQLDVPYLDTLRGKRVGVLENRKPNADILLAQIAELLREKYGVADVVLRAKEGSDAPATDALLDELARTCDAVICGTGD